MKKIKNGENNQDLKLREHEEKIKNLTAESKCIFNMMS